MHTYYWNPWSAFDELDRTFFENRGSSSWPAFDIEDDEDATTITADVPGMTEDDIDITIDGGTLSVRGERRAGDGRFVQRTRWYGAFERQFRIADGYDLDDIGARVTNGVLTIRLAKTAKMKPRKVKLGAGVIDKVKSLIAGDKDRGDQAATRRDTR